MTVVNAGATEKIIMLAQELVSEAKSGNEKCWKRLLLSIPCQTKNAVVKLKSELQKRADRADQSVLIFPGWC